MQRKLDRKEQLAVYRARYRGRGKEGKSRLLSDFCEHYGYERKYAIKLLGRGSGPRVLRRPPPGPEPRYQIISEVIEHIWKAAEQLCGKRLVRALPLWLPHYEGHFGKLLPAQRKLVAQVSASTLDRLLAQCKGQWSHGLGGTRPGSLLRHQVPIQGEVWNQQRVGFMEADSVAHCGGSLAGNFVWSLTYTNLASSGWQKFRRESK